MHQTVTRWWDRNNPEVDKLVRQLDRAEAVWTWIERWLLGWLKRVPNPYLISVVAAFVVYMVATADNKAAWIILAPLGFVALATGCMLSASEWGAIILKRLHQLAFMQAGSPEWQSLAAKLQLYSLTLEALLPADDKRVNQLLIDYLLHTTGIRLTLNLGTTPSDIKTFKPELDRAAKATAEAIFVAWRNRYSRG